MNAITELPIFFEIVPRGYLKKYGEFRPLGAAAGFDGLAACFA